MGQGTNIQKNISNVCCCCVMKKLETIRSLPPSQRYRKPIKSNKWGCHQFNHSQKNNVWSYDDLKSFNEFFWCVDVEKATIPNHRDIIVWITFRKSRAQTLGVVFNAS